MLNICTLVRWPPLKQKLQDPDLIPLWPVSVNKFSVFAPTLKKPSPEFDTFTEAAIIHPVGAIRMPPFPRPPN